MNLHQIELVRFPETFKPVHRCTVYDADGRPIATIDPRKRQRVELLTGERTTLEVPEWEQEPKKAPISLLQVRQKKAPIPDVRKRVAKGRDWYA